MKLRTVLLIVFIMLLGTAIAVRAVPEGVISVDIGSTETRASPAAKNATADGGNVTNLNISHATQTFAWQGFFGEINGSIVLEDASSNRIFSWNLTSLSGEIYASLDNAINFGAIFPENNCSVDNRLTGFGQSDSVNETFFSNTNKAIQVGMVLINASTTCAVNTYVNSGPDSTQTFHVLILTDDPNNSSDPNVGGNTTVYTALIAADQTGFDGISHDYQMIVPVNATTGVDIYFFYAELG